MTLLQIFRTVPARLPITGPSTIVYAGRRISSARDLPKPADDDEAERLLEIRRELERARGRTRWYHARRDPATQARLAAWQAEHREERLAYRRAYDERNRDRLQSTKTEWQRRRRRLDPEAHNAASRRYYARHREEVLAKAKAKYAATKAAGGEA